MAKNSALAKIGFTSRKAVITDRASTGRTARQQEIDMTIRELWNSQPRSEKIAAIAAVVFFPILFLAISVIVP